MDINPTSILLKKARKKALSLHIALGLYNANPHSPLHASYRNSIHCLETLAPNPKTGRLSGPLCKNRWCPTCQSIRIAKLINGYAPQLKALAKTDGWYFVTLTLPTVTAEDLPMRIQQMLKTWRRILHKCRDMKGATGLRKSECTIRPMGMYHHHYHVLILGKEYAERLVAHWLSANPDACPDAQDIRKADCNTMLELFKYFTKLFAKGKSGQRATLDFDRLDVIMTAYRGIRVFQPFGRLHPVSEKLPESEEMDEMASEVYRWVAAQYDWVGEDSGQPLSGYKPSGEILKLMGKGEVTLDAPNCRTSPRGAHPPGPPAHPALTRRQKPQILSFVYNCSPPAPS